MKIEKGWVTIAAQEIERSIRFYKQILEREPIVYNPNVYAEFEISGIRLGIYQPRSSEFTQGKFPRMSLCLQVENLETAIEELKQLGVAIGEIIQASHGREIYAYDPDGNRLILYEPRG